jgi:hyperosmotically inducible protein
MLAKKKLTALAMGLALVVCSSAPVFADSTPGSLVSDSVITTKVKAKMMADKAISALNISVETNNGVVTLGGTVPTDAEASAAIQTAESTADVKNVDASKLVVQKSGQPFADTVITAKVKGLYMKEKVFGDQPISVTGIGVETKDGVVYLTGHATREQEANAVRLAKSIDGVKGVSSSIKS